MERYGNEKLGINNLVLPVKAGEIINELQIVALGEDGYAIVATKEAGLRVAGICKRSVSNTGADGEEYVEVRRSAFVLKNAGDIKETDILKDCYIDDSETVTAVSEGTSKAGTILAVDPDGITVLFE